MAGNDNMRLAERLLQPIQNADRAIMQHYERGAEYTLKDDASPVTAADHDSEKIILEALAEAVPDLPVVSEESAPEAPSTKPPPCFVLVDPLDGTKEFISKQADFTVNVAVIDNGTPCFGIVYAPASSEFYYTPAPDRAVRVRLDPFGPAAAVSDLAGQDLRTREPAASGLTAVASRSHRTPETDEYLAQYDVAETISSGSSISVTRKGQSSSPVSGSGVSVRVRWASVSAGAS